MRVNSFRKAAAWAVALLIVAGAAATAVALGPRTTVSDYELEYAEIGAAADETISTDYEVDASVATMGVEGGAAESTDYSVATGVVAGEETNTGVSNWAEMD